MIFNSLGIISHVYMTLISSQSVYNIISIYPLNPSNPRSILFYLYDIIFCPLLQVKIHTVMMNRKLIGKNAINVIFCKIFKLKYPHDQNKNFHQ